MTCVLVTTSALSWEGLQLAGVEKGLSSVGSAQAMEEQMVVPILQLEAS